MPVILPLAPEALAPCLPDVAAELPAELRFALSLMATMLFPLCEADRERFIRGFVAQARIEAMSTPFPIERMYKATEVIALLEAARDEKLIEDIKTATMKGMTSGYILHFILNTAAYQETSWAASVASACRMVAGSVLNQRDSTIKRFYWGQYRSVSHFWAARFICEPYGDQIIPLPGGNEMRDFLRIAELFRELGEKMSHKRGPRILNPEIMWRTDTPPLPAAEFEFLPMSDESLAAARAGRRRS